MGAVSEGGWRRRRVGGQSADGGGAERVWAVKWGSVGEALTVGGWRGGGEGGGGVGGCGGGGGGGRVVGSVAVRWGGVRRGGRWGRWGRAVGHTREAFFFKTLARRPGWWGGWEGLGTPGSHF